MLRPVTAFDDTDLGAVLGPAVQDAIGAAMDIVDDQFTEEISRRYASLDPATDWRAFSDLHLPRQYRDQYTVLFIRRLHVCFLTVIQRLAVAPWTGLACRGEEFALNAILTQARIGAVDSDASPSFETELDEALTELSTEAFDDLDFELAFDPANDGIDDPDTPEGAFMGTGPLNPPHWFEPFRGRTPHPFVQR